ncbi:hypothetical protein VNO78_00045 [Psophocarpus tetragonolobus]|uniref:Uncharacterized protein n=1 Tax=Psophocarpus tetragonolobus TaxID=3891 RepID=A0AAN9XTW8_PSOTE
MTCEICNLPFIYLFLSFFLSVSPLFISSLLSFHICMPTSCFPFLHFRPLWRHLSLGQGIIHFGMVRSKAGCEGMVDPWFCKVASCSLPFFISLTSPCNCLFSCLSLSISLCIYWKMANSMLSLPTPGVSSVEFAI